MPWFGEPVGPHTTEPSPTTLDRFVPAAEPPPSTVKKLELIGKVLQALEHVRVEGRAAVPRAAGRRLGDDGVVVADGGQLLLLFFVGLFLPRRAAARHDGLEGPRGDALPRPRPRDDVRKPGSLGAATTSGATKKKECPPTRGSTRSLLASDHSHTKQKIES